MLIPMPVSDDMLEVMNELSAADATDGARFSTIPPSVLNAMTCELQAWRARNIGFQFVSGPNEIMTPVEAEQRQEQ